MSKVVYRSEQSADFDAVTSNWTEVEKDALRNGDPEAQESAAAWFRGDPGLGDANLDSDEIEVH